MERLDAQIALVQAKLTSAVKSGEPEDAPQMRHLWATHRRIRLEVEMWEG